MRLSGRWRSAMLAVTMGCIALTSFARAQGDESMNGAQAGSRSLDGSLDAEEREGIIFERQQLMLDLDTDAKTLGRIVAGTAPASKLAETTRSIAENASASVEAFETVIPGGRSKPEVWSDHASFMDDMAQFARNAEAMAKAGEQGNVTLVVNLMIDALPCKQCHDRYREPKSE